MSCHAGRCLRQIIDGGRQLTPPCGVRIIPANVGHGLRRAHAPMAFGSPVSAHSFTRVDFAGSHP